MAVQKVRAAVMPVPMPLMLPASYWTGDADNDGAKARFLRAARDGACRFFDGVPRPDYNTAHADQLHLERHGARVCR